MALISGDGFIVQMVPRGLEAVWGSAEMVHAEGHLIKDHVLTPQPSAHAGGQGLRVWIESGVRVT